MADIALVFHWSPDVMDAMLLPDLMGWRERARVRYERGDE
ncbi:putative phage tail-associated protein [Burkholderia aenigmatica]|uniref:Phage tail-associated protein n=1 Tax=Burkholderia aenigmatica TaxID=2015348 RepID=A0ABY6XYZ8_9BURK|nr:MULTISPECIES: GpE family phage tail protein [Burkholderia]VWD07621.1 putative phage tail-associated protein [Burkholderia aenigmatica]